MLVLLAHTQDTRLNFFFPAIKIISFNAVVAKTAEKAGRKLEKADKYSFSSDFCDKTSEMLFVGRLMYCSVFDTGRDDCTTLLHRHTARLVENIAKRSETSKRRQFNRLYWFCVLPFEALPDEQMTL